MGQAHSRRVAAIDHVLDKTNSIFGTGCWFTTRFAADTRRLRKLYFDSARHIVDNDKDLVAGRRAAYVFHFYKNVRPWAHHVMAEVVDAAWRATGLPKASFQLGEHKMHMVRCADRDDPVGLFCADSDAGVVGTVFVIVDDPTWMTRYPYELTLTHVDGRKSVTTFSSTFLQQAVFVPREWTCVVRGGDPGFMASLKLLTAVVRSPRRVPKTFRQRLRFLGRTLRGFQPQKSTTCV